MLRHKAAIQCTRYAIGFAGIIDPDEAERSPEVITHAVIMAPPPTMSTDHEAPTVPFDSTAFLTELEEALTVAGDIKTLEDNLSAADRAEIERLSQQCHDLNEELQGVYDRAEAAEAKLAQYEAQKPVGFLIGDGSFTSSIAQAHIARNHANMPVTALYASPAPSADLKAENERLRFRLNAAADDFDLIQQRINDGQIERAKATAWQGEREARAALNVEASNE